MVRRMLLGLLGLVLWTGVAGAQITGQNAWVQCGTNTVQPSWFIVEELKTRICYSFDESVATGSYIPFSIQVAIATVTLNADVTGTAGTAVVEVRACATGSTIKDANHCAPVLETLTASSDPVALYRGDYAFVVTTDPTVGEEAVLSVKGAQE